VKLIVEKEREILNFKPEESWKITADLEYNQSKFKALFTKLDGKNKNFKSLEDIKKFLHILFDDIPNIIESKSKTGFTQYKISKSISFQLNSVDKKDSKRTPGAPFTTSTLQQEASRKFGF
jgi:DNA topoisomerase-1